MDFLKKIENNSILIIPNNIKSKILKYIETNKLLLNIKFITFNDLKKGLLYDYNEKAIYHIIKSQNVIYEIAKTYIDNTYYITREKYDNAKLNKLLKIKNELNGNNLLIKDNLFIDLLKSKNKMYVYGFDYIDKFNKYLLEKANEYIKVETIEKENNNYIHNVYELDTINEEIYFVAENIAKLITEGIPLEKIYIVNYSDEYLFTINKIFREYNIPIYLKNNTTLFDTSIGKYFINNLTNDIEKLLDKIKVEFKIDSNEMNSTTYNKLINMLNNFYWTNNYVELKDIFEAKMKEINIENKHYLHEITSTSLLNNIFDDDEYVFLIGFNLGVIPATKKDEDYITDNIKPNIMDSSLETNIANKESTLKAIKNIKNLIITYKNISTFDKYYPSYLINGENLIKVKEKINYSNYSDDYNKLLLADKIDKLIKFNENDDLLKILNMNYEIPYNKFDNTFKHISSKKIEHELQEPNKWNKEKLKHSFSYSNISTYYKCPFRFYLDTFINLNDFEPSLSSFIGSLFHEVLDKCINTEEDVEKVYDEYVETHRLKENENNNQKRKLTTSDEYYINKLKSECIFIVNTIKEQNLLTNYKEEEHEAKVEINTNDLDINVKINATLKGFVDKYIKKNNDLVIIDYKTGSSDEVDQRKFEYGLDIQLPIYLYLLKNTNKEYTIVGMYLQHILNNNLSKDLKHSNEELKKKDLKLDGITLTDIDKLKDFDTTYEKSELVQALSLKKDGTFSKSPRYMNYDKENEIYNTAKKLIEDCINDVAEGKFDINPLMLNNVDEGCKYCTYKDICYKKSNQYNRKFTPKEDKGDEENE